jgi:hypothetical protein
MSPAYYTSGIIIQSFYKFLYSNPQNTEAVYHAGLCASYPAQENQALFEHLQNLVNHIPILVYFQEKAAARIELEWFKMDQSLQNAIWLKWVKLLPDELIRLRPVICTGYAWALLDAGEQDGCEPMLKEAEAGMAFIEKEEQEGILSSRRVTDREVYRKLPAFIANARAYKACQQFKVALGLNKSDLVGIENFFVVIA